MVNYTCTECGKECEIEEYEAVCGHHEHYESDMCLPCFNKKFEVE